MFPLPYDGAIDQLTLLVDGKEYDGQAARARTKPARRYEEIVRKNRDPALLEWVGTGMFQTSVFPVPPGAKRTVTLRYSQLCRKDARPHRFHHSRSARPSTPASPSRSSSIRVAIDSTHADQERLLAHARRQHRAARQHARRRQVRSQRTSSPAKTSACSTTRATASVGASVVSYRPKDERRRLLPAARQPRNQSGRRRRPSPRPSCSSSIAPAA